MSFLDIGNSRDRDAIVADYLEVKNRLKKRKFAKRINASYRKRYLEETFKPITKTSKEAAEKLAEELAPLKKELYDLSSILRPKATDQREREAETSGSNSTDESKNSTEEDASDDFGPLTNEFLDLYRDESVRRLELDTIFGLRKVNGIWMIGSETVTIGPNDTLQIFKGSEFDATPGFWSLVTRKYPRGYYSEEDLSQYKELLHETNALYKDYDPTTRRPHLTSSRKWTSILRPIWHEFRESRAIDRSNDQNTSRITGEGIKRYLQKNESTYNLKKMRGGTTQIGPSYSNLTRRDGMYLQRFGSKNVLPLLEWTL